MHQIKFLQRLFKVKIKWMKCGSKPQISEKFNCMAKIPHFYCTRSNGHVMQAFFPRKKKKNINRVIYVSNTPRQNIILIFEYNFNMLTRFL